MNDIGFRMIQLAGKGYCCSQMLMLLALETQGRENPDLVRAMAGLCMGAGNSGGACGVFTGAACVLALYGAKGSDAEKEADKLPLMLSELTEWFEQSACGAYAGISCKDIIGEDCCKPNPDRCGRLLVDTWGRILEILLENGFDPADPDRAL
ncbi:MAG: C_GCAxxG_C_C family protein [Deltaproteobacteria bacterium]|nr:C_GCAxxG_C_C family protein [Deltaproteobacteria bacterium]